MSNKKSIIAAIIAFAIVIIFATFGKSAPDAETAEFYNDRATSEVSSVAEVETVSEETPVEEQPAPEYNEITVTATAYCPCAKCCGKSDGITATGTKATAGRTIAVDPSIIPYGTEIIIDGITYVAEDCGGAVKGNAVDIFFDTHEEALKFGRQKKVAYVLKDIV